MVFTRIVTSVRINKSRNIIMAYTHSKDYLIELAGNPQTHGWLKDLAIKIVNSNGNLSDADIDNSVQQIKQNGVSTLPLPASLGSLTNNDVSLVSLIHHSGVCALAHNQRIDFSEHITLLYGNNGSGKSSYFRILNEIVGGNHQTPIKANIYAGAPDPVNIDIMYKEGVNLNSFTWNGTIRAISPLNLASVFDSSYTNTFLQKRSADTAIVLPYGLHLFTSLTNAMDRMKDLLQNEIDSLTRVLPSIKVEGLSDDVSRVISQRTYRSAQKRYIEDRYEISEAQITELNTQLDKLKQLNETNFDDKIKLLSNERTIVNTLLNTIQTASKSLNEIYNSWLLLLKELSEARKNAEETKTKISVFEQIGNTGNEDWKQFIAAGDVFTKGSTLDDAVCPYCRQPLIDRAVDVVSAYATYLTDKSITHLNSLLQQKEQLSKRIAFIVVSREISETENTILNNHKVSFSENIKALFAQLNDYKSALTQAVVSERDMTESFDEVSLALESELKAIIIQYDENIKQLESKKLKKNQEVIELQNVIKPLVERKNIHSQKDQFTDWFAKMHNIHELQKCQAELSTRSISTMAKNASQTLVTDNLKTKFQEELDSLGLKSLHVDLSDAGASRGQTFMQLLLVNNNSVTDILSEGEQKGVALALFIAERRMQLANNPIILDDPVNSLDHHITAKLVDRLVKLDNQIIIFSHNLLLQSSLANLKPIHECGVNQRASCCKTGKHLFMYQVNSYGRDKKGVLTEMKQDNVPNNLRKAKVLLDEVPFTQGIAIGGILRHTIELIIDENIFKKQIPVRFHGRKDTIHWEQLKTLNPDSALIDKLNGLFSRLSGGDLHAGIEQAENPIDHDELENIYNELAAL